jgi:hypothetical protein
MLSKEATPRDDGINFTDNRGLISSFSVPLDGGLHVDASNPAFQSEFIRQLILRKGRCSLRGLQL